MGSKDKSGLEKEKALLEALQNREKKLLSGMYGDFFGKNGSGNETGLSFGDRIDELEQKGRNVTSQFSSQADDLVNRQKAVSSQLKNRTDALQRANDALREVHSLLDNPLYNGMPSVTGRNTAGSSDTNNMNPIEDAGGEIDPGLMAGTDGDLFNGIAPGAFGVPGASGAPGAVQMDAPQVQEQQAAGKTAPAEKTKEEEKDPMEELDALIGLKTIKHDVRELTDFVRVQKLRKDGGLKSVPVSLHLVFTGNPGTGKTTVARIISRIYKQIGVLSGGQLVEVDRSGLVAGYVGQTAIKTSKKIEEARGGVLFIDEAYALSRKDDTFGQEAIDTILKAMEDNREDFVVIVAGYTEPMEKFINSNPGLKSRFNKYIEFPDYTIDELMGIFDMNCKKYDYTADEEVRAQVRAILIQRKMATLENFANAREVRNLFEEIITNQARRVAALESPSREDMQKLLLEDLVETAEGDAEKTLKKAASMETEKESVETADKERKETQETAPSIKTDSEDEETAKKKADPASEDTTAT